MLRMKRLLTVCTLLSLASFANCGRDIDVIIPCKERAIAHPEVLWRLNGKIYAVYAKGQKIHMAELAPGHYVTTDGKGCLFDVHADATVSDVDNEDN
jgi:hypothetical protein